MLQCSRGGFVDRPCYNILHLPFFQQFTTMDVSKLRAIANTLAALNQRKDPSPVLSIPEESLDALSQPTRIQTLLDVVAKIPPQLVGQQGLSLTGSHRP